MIKQLAHVCIGATDLAATQHFYCDILGMEKAFDFTKDGALYGFYIKTGENTFIEVFIQNEVNYERPIIRHLCLEVDDLDEFIADMTAKGIETRAKKRGSDRSWQTWITDPSGVPIEVMQYTEESSQFTGTTAIVNW